VVSYKLKSKLAAFDCSYFVFSNCTVFRKSGVFVSGFVPVCVTIA